MKRFTDINLLTIIKRIMSSCWTTIYSCIWTNNFPITRINLPFRNTGLWRVLMTVEHVEYLFDEENTNLPIVARISLQSCKDKI